MKEFLDNLYKQCASSRSNGVDELFDVIPELLVEKKFDVVNSILKDINLSRVGTSTMYSLIHLVSNYVDVLSEYNSIYQKCREEFARRGKSSEKISELFDMYKGGGPEDRRYNPDAPPYISPEKNSSIKLDNAIERSRSLSDKEITDYLIYYKAQLLRHTECDYRFRELRHQLGDEELRKRCIKSLREMADKLESTSGCWPGIYYCSLPGDPLLDKTFIDGIEVTISYPWPG